MLFLFVLFAWTLLAVCANVAFQLMKIVKAPFMWMFGNGDANLEAYWKRRIVMLTQESGALERRVKHVSSEISIAKQSLIEF